jgi:hypothetical protein
MAVRDAWGTVMRTVETFYKPGLEPAKDVIANISAVPRTLSASGMQWAKIWRTIVFILVLIAAALWCYVHYTAYIVSGTLVCWLACAAMLPIALGYIPWWLLTSYKRRKCTFLLCSEIYRNGTAVLGTVNTITNVNGPEQDCFHVERRWTSSLTKVRVDYTFPIENVLKTGSVILRESSVRYLKANDEICIIYLPDSPSDSIVFPVPGYDFFDMIRVKA